MLEGCLMMGAALGTACMMMGGVFIDSYLGKLWKFLS